MRAVTTSSARRSRPGCLCGSEPQSGARAGARIEANGMVLRKVSSAKGAAAAALPPTMPPALAAWCADII